ncbi:MAG: LacI family DNA-binding transcriptional regulator [Propionibacteriales bacterium]|nr:LacI family DNA-binding transcriptional regulator [Propionibacteriales bacterium]
MVDVASRARVSLKTVSRVVNREPNVRPETAERVRAAIKELGFRRNDGAMRLRSGRTASIGLIVEDLANPFYSAVAAACERVARRQDHVLITASAEGLPDREQAIAGAFLARRVDGLIIVPAQSDHKWLADEVARGLPVVFVDRPATGVESDTVLADNEGGMRSAVDHLMALGHERIGFLGDDPQFWTAQRRLAGFRTAMARHDRPADVVAMGPHSADAIRELLDDWTAREPAVTALITGNNRVTVEALRALRGQTTAPALVGFDDFELADMLSPAISVVAQQPVELGTVAADLLFSRIHGEHTSPRRVVLPTELIVRESGRWHR